MQARLRFLRAAVPAALLSLALAACSSEEPAPVESAQAPAAEPTEPATAASGETRADRRSARREAREARRDANPRGVDTDSDEGADPSRAEQSAAQVAARRERQQWWNDQALAEELGLDSAQQQAMSARATVFDQQRDAARQQRRSGESEYRDALAAGDIAAARLAVDALAEAAAAQERASRLYQVDLMEMLDAGQRQQLMARGGGRVAGAMRRLRERGADAAEAGDDD